MKKVVVVKYSLTLSETNQLYNEISLKISVENDKRKCYSMYWCFHQCIHFFSYKKHLTKFVEYVIFDDVAIKSYAYKELKT